MKIFTFQLRKKRCIYEEITYAQAISEAIDEEMRRDEKVMFGEDIGIKGAISVKPKGFMKNTENGA